MAKPRIFVSSTYYDLKHIRNSLENFIEQLGFEPVLFESGDIPFHHDTPLDDSCYAEIRSCHILALIIGGRYGSPSSETQPEQDPKIREKAYQLYNSITKREYETARERDIPIYIFVEKNVLAEYQTYKSNRTNSSIKWAHVDSPNIFLLLDDIYAQRRNNPVKDFEKFADISSYLRDQWAGLFADFLSRKTEETALQDLAVQVNGLSQISDVLKKYTESIMRKVQPAESEKLIQQEDKHLRYLQTIQNFRREPLIRTVMGTRGDIQGAEALFKMFKESNSLEEFLSKANFSDELTQHFVNLEIAQKEFDDIRARYLKRSREENDQDRRKQ